VKLSSVICHVEIEFLPSILMAVPVLFGSDVITESLLAYSCAYLQLCESLHWFLLLETVFEAWGGNSIVTLLVA
jgi:hypothetical protein